MDDSCRQDFPLLALSDWESHGYLESYDSITHSPLTGAVHPIFGYNRDRPLPGSTSTRRWLTLTQQEYEHLTPPLRLATQMIWSPASIRLLYSILYSPRIPTSIRHKDLAVPEISLQAIPVSAIIMIARALNRLAESISFAFGDLSGHGGSLGSTGPDFLAYPLGISVQEDNQLTGCPSFVAISVYYLNEFRRLYEQPDRNENQLLSLNFQLAVTLCHEIAHAMHLAVDLDFLNRRNAAYPHQRANVPFTEPFVEDQRVAELGLCWENEVFGGVIMSSRESLNSPLFVYEWPSFLARNAEMNPERTLPARLSTTYLISLYYIRNIQSQEYWDAVRGRAPSHHTLRIRKSVGLRREYQGNDFDRNWDPGTSSEGMWPTESEDSSRVLRNDGDEDEIAALANERPRETLERLFDEHSCVGLNP